MLINYKSKELIYSDSEVNIFKCDNGTFIKENLIEYTDTTKIVNVNSIDIFRIKDFYNILVKNNIDFNNKKILDIWWWVWLLKDLLPINTTYVNFEKDVQIIDYCLKIGINTITDIDDINLNNIDVVIFSHSFIYDWMINLLKNIYSKVNKGTIFIFEIPNMNSFYYKMFFFLNRIWFSFKPLKSNSITFFPFESKFFNLILWEDKKIKKINWTKNFNYYWYWVLLKIFYLLLDFIFNKIFSDWYYNHNNIFIINK